MPSLVRHGACTMLDLYSEPRCGRSTQSFTLAIAREEMKIAGTTVATVSDDGPCDRQNATFGVTEYIRSCILEIQWLTSMMQISCSSKLREVRPRSGGKDTLRYPVGQDEDWRVAARLTGNRDSDQNFFCPDLRKTFF